MGHHGTPDYTPEQIESFKQQFSKFKGKAKGLLKEIGATGQFLDGKLNDSDMGGIQFGILVQDGRVIFHFGEKPIQWIGFSKEETISLRDYLNDKIKQLP